MTEPECNPRLPIGKCCSSCGEWKLLDEFSRHKKSKDGRNWSCKPCAAKQNRKWREQNPDYKAPCLEANPDYHSEWYQSHKEEHDARQQKYRQEHKEELREYFRRYRDNNRDKVREWDREWTAENPDRVRAKARRWELKNPDKVLEKNRRRRANKLHAEGSYTNEEFRALCEQQGGKCLCCGESRPLTADHVVPISKGGSDYISNIQGLCQPCNSKKKDTTVDYR